MSPERAVDQAPSNLAGVLDALIGLWGVSETDVGRAAGVSRGTVGGRRKGEGAEPRVAELRGYADFFGVPVDLFDMEPNAAVVRAITDFGILERKPAPKRRLRLVDDGDGPEYAPRDSNPEPNDSEAPAVAAAASGRAQILSMADRAVKMSSEVLAS